VTEFSKYIATWHLNIYKMSNGGTYKNKAQIGCLPVAMKTIPCYNFFKK
jgi:hypothetical protein